MPTEKTILRQQPGVFVKRIGYTTYRVGIHFTKANKESLNDKIIRLVKNEAVGKAAEP